MCLVAFAIHASTRWPLVIASNRDEYFDRPALPLKRWQTASGNTIISGRDVRAGGTWLGMTPHGRMALLTNVRELPASTDTPALRSRGELALRWLESDMSAEQFMSQTDGAAYGGFNLVLGDFQRDQWHWLSNRLFRVAGSGSAADRPEAVHCYCRPLQAGVYALSNAALDTPWPKTLALKKAMLSALEGAAQESRPLNTPLWSALASRERAPSDKLPDTGLSVALETALSSAFVDSPERGYGTRCSTLLVATANDTAKTAASGERLWTLEVQEKTVVPAWARDLPDRSMDAPVSEVFLWQTPGMTAKLRSEAEQPV